MDKSILAFIEKLEVFKTKIKALHWDANSLSQHELCDDIADRIAEFQDQVSEVEQSISGKLGKEMFRPDNQEFGEVGTLKEFVENVIEQTNAFYKKLEGKGDKYIGMRSDCESFLSDMQRNLYLVNFTLKEELKARLRAKINESMPKNPMKVGNDGFDKFMGRRPKSIKARINQIYKIVKKYGIDSRKYHDEHWQAIEDYYRAITSLGCEVELKPCGHISNANSLESDGGYCDYDEYDHMPRSKQYAIKIMFDDGMNIDGYIKCMAAGTVEDPFASYDTCMVLWPKSSTMLENINEYGDREETRKKMGLAAKRDVMKGRSDAYENAMDSLSKRRSSKEEFNDMQKAFEMENKEIKLSESELKQLIKESALKVLSETPLNYDVDNFSGRWTKNVPDDYIDGESEGYFDDPNRKGEIESDLDDYASEEGDMRPMKDIENDYSWGLHDNQPVAQGVESDYYKTTKYGVPHEVKTALRMRNRDNSWTDRELRQGGRMMDRWVNGQRSPEQIGDAWEDLHYESKKPMRVTESELKNLIKEAAMQVIKDKFKNESIEIKPSKKGTFTAAATKHGKGVQEFANDVLNNKDKYSPKMVKKANFAKNFGGK